MTGRPEWVNPRHTLAQGELRCTWCGKSGTELAKRCWRGFPARREGPAPTGGKVVPREPGDP